MTWSDVAAPVFQRWPASLQEKYPQPCGSDFHNSGSAVIQQVDFKNLAISRGVQFMWMLEAIRVAFMDYARFATEEYEAHT
jgi:hypothetical protein